MPRPTEEQIRAKKIEIRLKYERLKRKKYGATQRGFAALRVSELDRLYEARYGETLPDNAAGRDCLKIIAHEMSRLPSNPRDTITDYARRHAPWLTLSALRQLLREVASDPRRFKAQTLAFRLKLIEQDRIQLRIRTIAAIDVTAQERAEQRLRQAKERERYRRSRKQIMPRAVYLARMKARPKPWLELGISRATWFRRKQRETRSVRNI